MPSTDAESLEIRAWSRCLRRDFPVVRRTFVLIRPRGRILHDGHKCQGLFYSTGKSFVILVERSPDWRAMIDALLHEWAHARIYPETEHSPRFDLEYGHIRRKYFPD